MRLLPQVHPTPCNEPPREHIAGTHDKHDSSGLDELVIRRATGDDAEAIGRLYLLEARLQEQLGGYSLTEAFDWTRWTTVRLETPEHRFIVAQRDASVVAFVHARLRSLPDGSQAPTNRGWLRRAVRSIRAMRRRSPVSPATPTPAAPVRFEGWGIVESLYVVESERRRGLARRLVEAAQEDLVAVGAICIEISVVTANEAAMAFWSSLGFRPFRAHLVSRIDHRRRRQEVFFPEEDYQGAEKKGHIRGHNTHLRN